MTAEDLRKSILQQAIQGKLVPQDPKDEPTSILLARIREEKERLVKEKKIKRDKNESIIYRGEDNSHYEKFADGTVKCIDDEIPFEIPQSWCWVRLKSIADVARGGSPRPIKDYITDAKDGINWIKIGDTEKDGKYINQTREKITPAGLKKSRLIHKGDFLLTNSMSFGRPYISNIEGCIHDGWLVISPIGESFIQDYLYYLLSSRFSYDQFCGVVSGAVVQNLNSDKVEGALFPLPPIEEQKRIVAFLEIIMPHIKAYEIAQSELDKLNVLLMPKLKKSVLQEAIRGKLVPQDPNDEPASVLLERIKAEKARLFKEGKLKKKDLVDSVIFKDEDNKYYEKTGDHEMCIDEELPFDIPETWTWIRFKNLVEFSLGKTPERSNSEYWKPADIPWVSIADMNDKSILLSTKEHISAKALNEKFGAKLSPKGTLIMSFKLTIGKVSILGIDAVHNEAIISIYPYLNENNIVRDFLYNFLCIITGYTSSTDAIKGATLNSKTLGEMLIPLPPLNEQKRIIRALDNALASIMSR